MRKIIICIAFCYLAAGVTAAELDVAKPAGEPAQTALDGTEWIIGEKGSKDAEVIIFGHGKFTSAKGVSEGYYTVPYKMAQKLGKIYWMAKTVNSKGEKRDWWGNVTGDVMEGGTDHISFTGRLTATKWTAKKM